MASGQVTLNEIVYRLKQLRDPLMLLIAEEIFIYQDSLINERLAQNEIYPSKARKGLGRYLSKGDPRGRFCHGRKIYRRDFRGQLQ